MSSRRSVGVSSSMGLSGFVFLWALALACALQVSSALAAGATTPANPFDASVRPLRIGDRVPSAQYVDQDARPVTISQFSGKTLIVGFIYTNCNDQCPILTGKFGRLAQMLPVDRFELLEISIDPARDSVAALHTFALAHGVHGPNWLLLRGAVQNAETVERPLGVSVVAGNSGELLHSERTVIVGPDEHIEYLVDDTGWTPTQVAAAARHVDGLPSSTLARLDLSLGKAVQGVCGGSTAARSGLADVAGVLGVVLAGGLIAFFIGRRIFTAAS